MEKRKRYSRLHNQIMFQLVKSVLKSLELYLTLKNKKFYYNLYKEKQEREKFSGKIFDLYGIKCVNIEIKSWKRLQNIHNTIIWEN